MVDEVVSTAPIASPTALQSPAPVASEVVVSSPNTAPIETPIEKVALKEEAGAPVVEVKAPETPVEPKSLLSGEINKETVTKAIEPVADKIVPADKPADAPKGESDQSVDPAPLPSYEPWKLPEGVTLDNEKASKFTEILGGFQGETKAEKAMVQEFGQKLVDYHIELVKENVDRVQKAQNDAWVKQTEAWKEAFVNDPEIGGKRQDTTINSAIRARDLGASLSSDPKFAAAQKQEFVELMNTGFGNHPALLRTLSNLNTIIDGYREKYESETGVKPLGAVRPVLEKRSKTQTLYGKSA